MKNAEGTSIQIQDLKPIALQLITVGIPIPFLGHPPLLCHLQAVRAVKAQAIVIVWLPISKPWLLNNAGRSMEKMPDHDTTSTQIILPWEYKVNVLCCGDERLSFDSTSRIME